MASGQKERLPANSRGSGSRNFWTSIFPPPKITFYFFILLTRERRTCW